LGDNVNFGYGIFLKLSTNAPKAARSSTKKSASETKSASVEKMVTMGNKMKTMHEMHEKVMHTTRLEE
jgi:hypothetical protein